MLLRFVRFSAVGWMGVGVQLSMLALLKGGLELHYLVATALAVEGALLHNFLWHERWTWKDRGLVESPGRIRRLLRFHAGTGPFSILGNVVLMRVYVGELGLHYVLGSLASIASCAVVNFIVSDRLVFLRIGKERPAMPR